jgi:DNA ligase 1
MDEKQMTLGRDWLGQRIKGWLLSEKFDGCRSYWDGARLWTRGGNIIPAPDWFTRGLPAGEHLDCEIWAGYRQLTAARLATQHGKFTPACRLIIHDCPTAAGTWAERMAVAARLVAGLPHVQAVAAVVCRNDEHALDMLAAALSRHGEGLVARHPKTRGYEKGRTSNLLKIKDATRLYERMTWTLETEAAV